MTYEKATKIEPGVMICNAGYAHCPAGDSNHYHCSKCGGVTGMMAHYAGNDKPFFCEQPTTRLIRGDGSGA